VVVHIQDQVLAHDCQTDQCDVCRLFHDLAPEKSGGPPDHGKLSVLQMTISGTTASTLRGSVGRIVDLRPNGDLPAS
jgi:hypothetical protein